MNLNVGWVELNNALKDLRIRWGQTQTDWDDAVSKEFEEHYLLPLEAQVVAAMRAMDRLAPVLTKAQRDCS